MGRRMIGVGLGVGTMLSLLLFGVGLSQAETPSTALRAGLEPVRGQGCYTYGDDDTPAKAKKAALALARQRAVESYRVYVQSATTVKNFQLEDDLIQSVSAAMLQDEQIEKQDQKDRDICVTITAKINPVKMEELIQQKTKAKDVAQAAQAPLLTAGSAFGVRVWTNKQAGDFVEGDRLIVSVQSDRDGYLKLDYYQADGTVVHLVPNIYGGEAFIKAGQTYTFGGPGGRESFTIDGPFGTETIKALVSTQPFAPSMTAGRNVEESRSYLRGLQAATRGVKVEGGAGTRWAEAAAGLTTTSKTVKAYACALAGARGVKAQGNCAP